MQFQVHVFLIHHGLIPKHRSEDLIVKNQRLSPYQYNWLHIQDGTGDPMNNTHDLVVTTDGEAEKGAKFSFALPFEAGKELDRIVSKEESNSTQGVRFQIYKDRLGSHQAW